MGLGSEIRDAEKIYPGFRDQKGTGLRIRIRSTIYQCEFFCPTVMSCCVFDICILTPFFGSMKTLRSKS
jgi:hypothetical protein